jgi:hypothetical protein
MSKIINLILGLIFGTIFAVGLILVLAIFFVVLIPFIFYFTVKEVLRALIKN